MIPKPKYIENILEINKSYKNFLVCDVVCKCGSKHFIGYKNILIKSEEQKIYEKQLELFSNKYSSFTSVTEDGTRYLCGMKGIFQKKEADRIECKSFDSTEIIKVNCVNCGKEHILFDSRFYGYNAVMSERESRYDNVEYSFTPIKWNNDKKGVATFSIRIENDETLEEFTNNAYEVDEETYSNAFGWIIIQAKNLKTNVKKTIIDIETA